MGTDAAKNNPWDRKAPVFLAKHGVTVTVKKIDSACPPWEDDQHNHGDHYEVVFERGKNRVRYDFWNTWDNEVTNKKPTVPMVLSQAANDTRMPSDRKILSETMKLPNEAIDLLLGLQNKLKKFFTKAELRELWHMAFEGTIN